MAARKKPAQPGDRVLGFDPGAAHDAGLAFIGHIRSPWSPGDCPRNLTAARKTGKGARVELRPGYGPGLEGLEPGQHVILIYWLDRDRRDLIAQQPHGDDAPRGTFALRSPVRPNPLGLACVRITALDAAAGVMEIDAVDAFDGTPLLDIKPWRPGIDMPAGI
ncbi:tRNA (N6-threonylcarbamoyladenosine(37)-N6)-methyltransferase TrmO [Maritimibacter sp. 55A14]|uniref:SAM-dependent methyltransferase n=1 Tax=Maritimibacter sp. 55A14 TaxID=2174844 RepID=UPI000D612B78|nr:SAM-dependent methyltransferase [Maritimibacter sp. 55A14]PWE32396.1 tRNA (N6-threonylcarbamoyladenosine(37)-N6)-methyltransferase TrmO [Maritimibacter sp. 55A14]